MGLLVEAFKAASSSGRMLVSEAAEVMLKVATTRPGLPFPWQASSHVRSYWVPRLCVHSIASQMSFKACA